jgi:membrane-associated PAP2 superfamily phosphatase
MMFKLAQATHRTDAFITLIALVLLLLWDASGFDLLVIQAVGTAQGFAWREHWFTAQVLHTGGRWLSTVLFAAVAFSAFKPLIHVSRAQARWCLCAVSACLILIPLLKRWSQTSCPWNLVQFGGTAPWVSHWALGVHDGGGGHCFPSGHASGAFCFFAIWFVLRAQQHRATFRALIALCFIGAVFGLAQTLRGAHYPSHTLWTAWICWVTTAALWHAWGLWSQRKSRAITGTLR